MASLGIDSLATVTLNDPVQISSSLYEDGLSLEPAIEVRVIYEDSTGEYRCTTTRYLHTISTGKKRILAFHWHPLADSPEKGPHLHPGKAFIQQEGTLHLPTSRTTLEFVVGLMLDHFGGLGRPGWESVLGNNRELHEKHRSWDSYSDGDGRAV